MGTVLNEKQKQQLASIKEWAVENGGQINYTILMDLLKNEYQPFPDEEETVNQVLYELIRDGIEVEPLEEGEGYPAESPEPEQFIPALVNISQPPMNVFNLMERLANNEIDLSPAFQRHWDLWDPKRQSRLIESLMLRIPIPSFYFDTVEEGRWKVIDGLQRLTAFRKYLVNEKKEKLSNLQYLKDFNGKTFDELPRQYIRRIKEAPIIAFCVNKGTPEIVTYNIFQRINTGGLQLSSQEIRNAMYQGNATRLAGKLAVSEEFLEATMHAVKPDRMLDQEYVIRFFSFTELDYEQDYHDNIDSFLIQGMKKVNTYSEGELKRIEDTFYRVMRCCQELFGKYAFRKISEDGRRGPINKALFELWAVCLSTLTEEQLARLTEKKAVFMQEYEGLFREKKFSAALRSGKCSECIRRIKRGKELLKEFL